MNTKFGKGVDLDKWNKISRIAAFFASIVVWWISIRFSVDGFNFSLPNMIWVGWALGFCITVIEIVFNKPGVHKNLTLWVVGAMAYCYGMYTNIAGIWVAQGEQAGYTHFIFPVILGCAIEWIPEVLFTWSLLGMVTPEGDFLGNVINMFTKKSDKGYSNLPAKQYNPPATQWRPKSTPVKKGKMSLNDARKYRPPEKKPVLSWDAGDLEDEIDSYAEAYGKRR
jgi:hypothetical protein